VLKKPVIVRYTLEVPNVIQYVPKMAEGLQRVCRTCSVWSSAGGYAPCAGGHVTCGGSGGGYAACAGGARGYVRRARGGGGHGTCDAGARVCERLETCYRRLGIPCSTCARVVQHVVVVELVALELAQPESLQLGVSS
jgi:hypothetical protein